MAIKLQQYTETKFKTNLTKSPPLIPTTRKCSRPTFFHGIFPTCTQTSPNLSGTLSCFRDHSPPHIFCSFKKALTFTQSSSTVSSQHGLLPEFHGLRTSPFTRRSNIFAKQKATLLGKSHATPLGGKMTVTYCF